MSDRMLREVTREEWIDLPVEVCYAYREKPQDPDNPLDNGKVRYFEIIKPQEN